MKPKDPSSEQHAAEMPLEDVLDAYTVAGPSQETLPEWVRRYPQYEEQLTEFTVRWSVLKWVPRGTVDGASPDEEAFIARGMEVVDVLLAQQQSETPPATTLKEFIVKRLFRFAEVARQVGLDFRTLAKLDLGQLHFRRDTTRHCLIVRLASALETTFEIIDRLLPRSPRVALGANACHNRPEAFSQDFVAAVRKASGIDEEERRRWVAMELGPEGEEVQGAVVRPQPLSHWGDIRRKARSYHRLMLAFTDGDASAAALTRTAIWYTSLHAEAVPLDDPLLEGGEAKLDREHDAVWYSEAADPLRTPFLIAHELAHYWLKTGGYGCLPTEIDPEEAEEVMPTGPGHVEAYSPRERQEREANVFAREFLLPTDRLKEEFVTADATAAAVASRYGVLENMVHHQLTRALLTCELEEESVAQVETEEEEVTLDESQQRAAHALRGPVLVDAGPGTGKTRTLTGRVLWLLRQGVDPQSILALTFSNKAAEEMRMRVARRMPEEATAIWMGTFHAYGLELLSKRGGSLGLPASPRVLGPVDTLYLLERLIPKLPLHYYKNLSKPLAPLWDVLQAISRAKDELVGPDEYAELAKRMLAEAEEVGDEKAIEKAERALEVAGIYGVYQEHLERGHLLDFGDLIARAETLLREHQEVRETVRATHQHVLVDEFQDMNFASGRLLKQIVGSGERLWVVGDARQAIYRFRGASTSNIEDFEEDYPDANVFFLKKNYRSQQPIIDVFSALAPQMRAAQKRTFEPWQAHRKTEGGRVLVRIAESPQAEELGLAREIRQQEEAGIPLRHQAVLCREHNHLAQIAHALERAGVPVLYLGHLFERPEVRDLLSIVELACTPNGNALVRVARLPEYDIPLPDVQHLLQAAREQNKPFPAALALTEEVPNLTDKGRKGFARLHAHLSGSYPRTAWGLLTDYLFNRSGYLRLQLQDDSVQAQQQRLAMFQLLRFAAEQRSSELPEGEDPKRVLLSYIRRLVLANDDRQLWQAPEWAAGIEAVRLLTVHASKGLEFKAVYMPRLGKGIFPRSWRGDRRPLPTGLLHTDPREDHEEEEECLFFVALSRARDVLCLSRATQGYRHRLGKPLRSAPSPLLIQVSSALPVPPDGQITWSEQKKTASLDPVAAASAGKEQEVFDVQMLDLYLSCPEQYRLEYVVDLRGRGEDAAYLQFHRCVYSVLYWILEECEARRVPTADQATLQLESAWEAHGPADYPLESAYRQEAEHMVAQLLKRATMLEGRFHRPTWEIPLQSGLVRVAPDFVEVRDDSVLVQRWRTGRLSTTELGRDIHALYRTGAEAAYPGQLVTLQAFSVSTGETETPNPTSNALARYEAAIQGILEADFRPNPGERCPQCAFFFICTSNRNA